MHRVGGHSVHPLSNTPISVGVDGLAAARSHSPSNNTLCCYSLRSCHFVTSTTRQSHPPSNFDLSESRCVANRKRIFAKLSLPIEGKVDASHENYRTLSNAGEQTDEGNEVHANYSSQEPILVYTPTP